MFLISLLWTSQKKKKTKTAILGKQAKKVKYAYGYGVMSLQC